MAFRGDHASPDLPALVQPEPRTGRLQELFTDAAQEKLWKAVLVGIPDAQLHSDMSVES